MSGRLKANAIANGAITALQINSAINDKINAAYTQANTAANTVRVSANDGSTQSNVQLNFVNTATVGVTVTAGSAGNANISFTAADAGFNPFLLAGM